MGLLEGTKQKSIRIDSLCPIFGDPVGDTTNQMSVISGGHLERAPETICKSFRGLGAPREEVAQVVADIGINIAALELPLKDLSGKPRVYPIDTLFEETRPGAV